MDSIPIQNLTPDTAPPSDKSIRAIVTLSWPYSSSTRQCALLLADPDFRLRTRKGQVRARFTGASAEAVAKSHVGIGDEVELSLQGASWEEDFEATRTPGRSVDGELLFRRRLVLNVSRSGENVRIDVDAPMSPPRPRSPERASEIVTPLPKAITALRSTLDGTVDRLPNYTYTSPAFAKRLRLSGESYLESAYDPFADDTTALGDENAWKRSSFGNNTEWRYADKTPSPKKVHFTEDVSIAEGPGLDQDPQQAIDAGSGSPSKNTRSKAKMLPPPLPPLQLSPTKTVEDALQASSESTSHGRQAGPLTPELRPVQSPTLPLPSPFPVETRQAQFGLVDTDTSPQEESRLHQLPSETLAEIEGTTLRDDSTVDDVMVMEKDVEKLVADSQPGTKPHRETTQPVLLQQDDTSVDSESVTRQQEDLSIIEDPAEILPRQDLVDRAEQANLIGSALVDPPEILPNQDLRERAEQANLTEPELMTMEGPQTPVKQMHLPPQIAMGLDGASSAPPSAHATPQSEKEKIMAQTYRSLFGFQDSTPATKAPIPAEMQQKQAESVLGPMWFSDVTKYREEAWPTAAAEVQDHSVPATENPPADASEELFESGAVQDIAHRIEQPDKQPSTQPQIEVVDLASSSESEEEPQQEKISVRPPPQRPLPQRRLPKLEIQDSLADPEGEDLLAQESQALRGVAGAVERRKEASRLQQMVAEESSQAEMAEATPSEPVGIEVTTQEEITTASQPDQGVVLQQAQSVTPIQVPSPLSPVSPDPFEFLTSPTAAMPSSQVEFGPGQGIDMLESPTVEPSEIVPSALLHGSAVESASQHFSQAPVSVSPTPADEMHIDLTSPVYPGEAAVLSGGASENAFGAQSQSIEHVDLISPIDIELPQIQSQQQADVESLGPMQESPVEPMFAEHRDSSIQQQDAVVRPPLYPSLPLSPSNSQSLQGMLQNEGLTVQETLSSVFPPTPQLTQVESITEADVPTEDDPAVSQAETLVQPPQQGRASEESQPLLEHVVEEPTINPAGSQAETIEEDQPSSRIRKKKPARKSMQSRISNVPDVISPWFSPKRSSIAEAEPTSNEVQTAGVPEAQTADQTDRGVGHDIPISINGFSTALSYFTPLSKIDEFLNPSSQQAYGTNTIDLIAVVSDQTKEPVRAKAGPRDYYTIFKVTDYTLSAQKETRVEIYRPWHATLPVAMPGDVILLRAFAVKSRNRHPYLLSTDASAWCVWRNSVSSSTADDSDRPIWPRKGANSGDSVREEIKGPPVELGEEEREHALRLSEWWSTVAPHALKQKGNDDMNHGGMNGNMTEPIAAKL